LPRLLVDLRSLDAIKPSGDGERTRDIMRRDPSRPGWILVGLAFGWALAIGSFAAGQEDEAAERKVMERFLTVLEKNPRRGTALDRVYGYHVENGSLDGLVKCYEDRTKADPKEGASWLLLGLVEAQRGRDAQAVAAFREAERLRPDDALVPYYLGQVLVLVGQPDAAVEAFERSLTRKPLRVDLLEVFQALGRVHQRARRSDKALAVWTRLEATFPDDNRVREQIAAALAEEDQPTQALAKFEILAKEVKDDYRKIQFTIEAADLKIRLGRSPEALVDFEKLLARLDPGSWLFKEVRRKIEEVFLRGDDLAGLAKYYEGWIGKTPDDVDAMARLGKTYAQLGRASESRSWLDKAVKLAPSRRDLRLALIEQLAEEKKFAEASSEYEKLVRAEPGNPDLIRDWGRLLLRDTSRP
jgi:tetratricopeptide (TPR) repeat protein